MVYVPAGKPAGSVTVAVAVPPVTLAVAVRGAMLGLVTVKVTAPSLMVSLPKKVVIEALSVTVCGAWLLKVPLADATFVTVVVELTVKVPGATELLGA